MNRKALVIGGGIGCFGIFALATAKKISTLHVLDQQEFSTVKSVEIHDAPKKSALNELGQQVKYDPWTKSIQIPMGNQNARRKVRFQVQIPGESDVSFKIKWRSSSHYVKHHTVEKTGDPKIVWVYVDSPIQDSNKSVGYQLEASSGVWQTRKSWTIGKSDGQIKWEKETGSTTWKATILFGPETNFDREMFRVAEVKSGFYVQNDHTLSFEVTEKECPGRIVNLQSQTYRPIKTGCLAFGKAGDKNDQVQPSGKVSLVAVAGYSSKKRSDAVWTTTGQTIRDTSLIPFSFIKQGPGENLRRLIFDIDKPVGEYRASVDDSTQRGRQSGGEHKEKAASEGWSVSQFYRFPQGQKRADVTLLLGTGGYKLLRTLTARTTDYEDLKKNDLVFMTKPSNDVWSGAGAFAKAPRQSLGKFVKLHCYDKNNRLCSMSGFMPPNDMPIIVSPLLPTYKPEDVARVEVWAMDIEKHLFKNVALQPDSP